MLAFWSAKVRLARAYKAVFLAPDRVTPTNSARAILADLRAFCRADASCVVVDRLGHIDTHATSVAEGRREVWLRLMEHLNLDDQTVRDLGDDHHG